MTGVSSGRIYKVYRAPPQLPFLAYHSRMKKITLALSFLLTSQAFAMAPFANRIRCPQAKEWNSGKELSDYTPYLNTQKITPVTAITVGNLEKFLTEYHKFPETLAKELIDAGAKISLIEGEGVTADPSWNAGSDTFDGRSWDKVPGSGGSPKGNATRVVINHLYDRHGSVNLVLHEHGHTLDQLYKYNVLSSSKTWKRLTDDEPQIKSFMLTICGTYCTANLNEGFAELFAFYHACGETRALVEKELPGFASFLKDLKSVKDFKASDDQL